MEERASDVTQLLLAWQGGNHEALQQLLPLVYGESLKLPANRIGDIFRPGAS